MTDATPSGAPTPDDLKLELKDRLGWLCSIFGQPSELLRVLTFADWRRLRVWVRGVEALAVRLVQALAATMPATAGVASSRAPRPLPAVHIERAAPDTDYPDSERWIGVRVRLADAPAAPARSAAPGSAPNAPLDSSVDSALDVWGAARPAALPAPANAPPQALPGFRSAHRLALRLEAVIRVAGDPARYAKRLARRKARPARRNSRTLGRRLAPPAPREVRVTALGPPIRTPARETG